MKRSFLIAVFLYLFPLVAFSVEPSEILDDPALEERAREISKGLRCLVCQNQSLADSASGLATDLRDEVYQMVIQDNSQQTIKTFLVERYGNFVLYDPPLNPSTSILWFAPFILAILAVGLVIFFSKKPKIN